MEATPWLTKVFFIGFMTTFDVCFVAQSISYLSSLVVLVVAGDRVGEEWDGSDLCCQFKDDAIRCTVSLLDKPVLVTYHPYRQEWVISRCWLGFYRGISILLRACVYKV